jgi:hypothetical protein
MTQLYSNAGFEQVLEIRKGATFKLQLSIADTNDAAIDITGWEFRATVASKQDPPESASQNFTFGTLNVNGLGTVVGTLTPTKTGTLVANDNRMAVARYRWNCDAKTPEGEIIPICFGDVLVKNTDVDWS